MSKFGLRQDFSRMHEEIMDDLYVVDLFLPRLKKPPMKWDQQLEYGIEVIGIVHPFGICC